MMDGLEKLDGPRRLRSPATPMRTRDAQQLPDDMDEALQLTQAGDFCDRALGPELSKIYKDLKRAEILAFWAEITPLERTTYL
jgi:glutamine synthetase